MEMNIQEEAYKDAYMNKEAGAFVRAPKKKMTLGRGAFEIGMPAGVGLGEAARDYFTAKPEDRDAQKSIFQGLITGGVASPSFWRHLNKVRKDQGLHRAMTHGGLAFGGKVFGPTALDATVDSIVNWSKSTKPKIDPKTGKEKSWADLIDDARKQTTDIMTESIADLKDTMAGSDPLGAKAGMKWLRENSPDWPTVGRYAGYGAAGLGTLYAIKKLMDWRAESQKKARIQELIDQGIPPDQAIAMANEGV